MDLSVIIPARNEEFLSQTINSVLNASGETTEIIVVLDGYECDLLKHPRLKIIHNQESIGQRASCNKAIKNSNAKYIMKLDAHCSIAKGFDRILPLDCKYDWIVIPRMYVLNAFHWKCNICDKEYPQGPLMKKCDSCHQEENYFEKKIIWKIKRRKKTDYMWFNTDLRIKYFDSKALADYGQDIIKVKHKYNHKYRSWAQDEITDVMCGVGACWFMHRDFYWDIEGLDEKHGSWGQMAVEIACKAWLSGGRHVVNKKTWFAHLFRTQKDFSWPYKNDSKDQKYCREYSKDLWLNNKWRNRKYDLEYLIDKFSPLPEWDKQIHMRNDPTILYPGWEKYIKERGNQMHIKNDKNDITILYYTANKINEHFASKVKDQIKFAGKNIPIISISQKPITDMGENICIGNIGQSLHNIYKQVLIGAYKAKTKYVVLCEDDVLYVPEHFVIRPQKEAFIYNLNRWNLHTENSLYSYRKRIILSQCIANREALINCLEQRFALQEIPKKYCGEPGQFEKNLGLPEIKYETIETKEPNIVIAHENNTTGIKLIGKDAEPKVEISPWGNGQRLLNAIYFANDQKEKSVIMRKRSQYSYIKSKVFEVKDLSQNRLEFVDPKKPKGRPEKFLQVFPPFIQSIHDGKTYTDDELKMLPYYPYLLDQLNPADRIPKISNKGKRHVINLMKDGIKLYHDIKNYGLKAPLDMFIENNKLVLHRGGRRLEILKILGRKYVPARVFKSRQIFRKFNPDKTWMPGFPSNDSMTIHDLAIEQFVDWGHKATDKYWVHDYTRLYDKELLHLKNEKKKSISLLEIGVKRGASLKLWQKAFPRGKIYGIDKEPITLVGFEIFIGEQQDKEFLKRVIAKVNKFDIIIDDGSHTPSHQKISFETLWPHLEPQGVYVIEDLHWNYRTDKDKQAINMLKNMINNLYIDPFVYSINFYYNICFIRKR